MYVVQPPGALWFGHAWEKQGAGPTEGFSYTSDSNAQWMTVEQIRELVAPYETGA